MLCAFKSGISFEKALKQSVITKIFQQNYTNFKQKTNSEYLSLMSNDITAIEQDYLKPLIDVIRSTIHLIIYTIVLIIGINYKIAIIIISLSIIAIAAPKMLGNRLENARSLYQKNLGKYTTLLSDLLSGFKLIDQHTLPNFLSQHEQGLDNNAQLRYAYGKEKSNVLTISLFFTKLVKVIVFGITGYLFYKQEITIGSGVATFSYVYSFIEPINNILYDVTSIKSIKKVIKNINQLNNIQNDSQLIINHNFKQAITIDHIDYNVDNFYLKSGLINLYKGQKIAIIGDSGSGKSTLLNLIMNFYPLNSGNITIDSKNVVNNNFSNLIYYQDQTIPVFHDDLMNNISIFNTYQLSDFDFNEMPNIFSKISNNNSKDMSMLSGGEKQCLAFLRLWSKNADILLLDEPFSALNIDIRNQLTKQLCQNPKFRDKTVLLVTHDLNNLNLFDRILKVNSHQITEIFPN